MALPANFWQDEKSFNQFRTKVCQRLTKDGVCDWRSQCQYSHDVNWPRRSPKQHQYSPEVCQCVQAINHPEQGVTTVENNCREGPKCKKAHSKEEVLFHPHIFKTKLCEDYQMPPDKYQRRGKSQSQSQQKCHRYYCPFAHGKEELRSSPLPPEAIDQCIRAVTGFPSDDCCRICTPCRISPSPATNGDLTTDCQDGSFQQNGNNQMMYQNWTGGNYNPGMASASASNGPPAGQQCGAQPAMQQMVQPMGGQMSAGFQQNGGAQQMQYVMMMPNGQMVPAMYLPNGQIAIAGPAPWPQAANPCACSADGSGAPSTCPPSPCPSSSMPSVPSMQNMQMQNMQMQQGLFPQGQAPAMQQAMPQAQQQQHQQMMQQQQQGNQPNQPYAQQQPQMAQQQALQPENQHGFGTMSPGPQSPPQGRAVPTNGSPSHQEQLSPVKTSPPPNASNAARRNGTNGHAGGSNGHSANAQDHVSNGAQKNRKGKGAGRQ